MSDDPFYPPIRPRRSGHLDRGGGHEIYWEVSGSPTGRPVVFLHGGPGAGCAPVHRRFFDPKAYRIVLFDQRGCGRSRPFGEVANNSTQDLIGDIEALREMLQIDRWVVFGGSWGSTLGLAYAQAHPERVMALVLRGIFLARRAELDWFLYGLKTVFPENWRILSEHLPRAERGDLLSGYHRRLLDPDPQVHVPAARVWSWYEGACSTLKGKKRGGPATGPVPDDGNLSPGDRWALGLARMEAHYFKNDLFLSEGELLDRIGRIQHIPGTIVQGRYDMICPPVSADDLAEAWPAANYHVVAEAGHSALEPGIARELVKAADRFRG